MNVDKHYAFCLGIACLKCFVIYLGILGWLHVFFTMWACILVYYQVLTRPVVEQCITERATLYKYIWKKRKRK